MSDRSSSGFGLLPVDSAALGIAVLTSGLAAAIVFLPSWRQQADQASLIGRRVQAEQRLSLASHELPMAERTLMEVTSQVESSGFRTLPVSALNTRLAELVDLAGKSGMKLDALSPGERIKTTRTMSVQIKMSGTCAVDAFQGFLQQLRVLCPDIAVTSLQLNRQKPEGDRSNQEMAVEGATFTLDLVWHAAPDAPISANRSGPP